MDEPRSMTGKVADSKHREAKDKNKDGKVDKMSEPIAHKAEDKGKKTEPSTKMKARKIGSDDNTDGKYLGGRRVSVARVRKSKSRSRAKKSKGSTEDLKRNAKAAKTRTVDTTEDDKRTINSVPTLELTMNTVNYDNDESSLQLEIEEESETKSEKIQRLRKYVTFEKGKAFKDWVVAGDLGQGGFGKVYLVEKAKDPKVKAALKAEPKEIDGGSSIKYEKQILMNLNPTGKTAHVPQAICAGKHTHFSYMIMSLLGANLRTLRVRQGLSSPDRQEHFSVGTWARIGIQSLYALKTLHDIGYVHRDVKPSNFAIGKQDDAEAARIIFILDFGLSRSYAFKFDGLWIPRIARSKVSFRGTPKYCSPNIHDQMEQSRRDDLWSLMYILIEFHCGLPWKHNHEKSEIAKIKCFYPDDALMQNMPRETHSIIPLLRKMDYYDRPDYHAIYQILIAIMKRHKCNMDDAYDWEKDKKIIRPSKDPAWYTPENFFKADPIGNLRELIKKAPALARKARQMKK